MCGRILLLFLWIFMDALEFLSVTSTAFEEGEVLNATGKKLSPRFERFSTAKARSFCTCTKRTESNSGVMHEKFCSCSCEGIHEIPSNISSSMCILSVLRGKMEVLTGSSFKPYRETLRDVNLFNLQNLRVIEEETFRDLPLLRTIYISGATSLTVIDPKVFSLKLPHFKTLRIVYSGLEAVPDLNNLETSDILHTIDLESNYIKRIPSKAFRIRAEELLLSFNVIEEIESEAFHGSQIAKLILKGNQKLTKLNPDAFHQLKSLRLLIDDIMHNAFHSGVRCLVRCLSPDILVLDLSMTSITFLPTNGLSDLEVLRLEDTKTLKVFPSVYNFDYIKEASLTYPYHCCAFQFPDTHSPKDYARHQEFLRLVQKSCSERKEIIRRRKPLSVGSSSMYAFPGVWGSLPEAPNRTSQTFMDFGSEEEFHEEATIAPLFATCGNLSKNYRNVTCSPVPDAFNPCEDLMGNWALRVQVWIVAIFALVGNLAVLLVLISSRFRMTVPKFLMCNLAVADLCMGLYLLLIAIMDVRSMGVYFNFAIDWQGGWGCQVAGFLTVLSSELSIFTLAVITSERWYTITYAIHLNKRLKLRLAVNIMACGWVYSIIMAVLPLVGVSNYSKTSICLPLENRETKDVGYLITLLVFNGLAFWMICTCYGRMYCSVRKGQEMAQTHSDMTVAKRMAMLVFTDFACWAPITFFGLTALAGYPLIDVPKTKILLVFFYPLNSCANPYLYALLTQQYQRDLFVLLSKYGICSERAAKFRGQAGAMPKCKTVGSCGRNESKDTGTNPNHRGSLLTTMTSLDNSNNVPARHSLGTVREYRLAAVELLPVTLNPEQPHQTEQGERLSSSSCL